MALENTTHEMLVTHALNGSQRQADSAAFISQQSQLQHIRVSTLADAFAAQTLRTSGIAAEVLQTRASSDQPQGAKAAG